MSLKLKHTLVSLQAILAIAAVLNLGAPVACGASPAAAKAAAVPHVSWGQLKALYRGSVPEAAEPRSHGSVLFHP